MLGLFINKEAKKQNIRTAEDRIAAMFRSNGLYVITASDKSNKVRWFLDTLFTIIKRNNQFDIAFVPLFGTWRSFLWQECATRILKLFGKKLILGIHGGSIPGRINNGAKRFYNAAKRADILYAPSLYFKEIFETKNFDVHVIENPLDIAVYTFYRKEKIRPRIVWMRAFEDVYNPFMAIRVAKKLAAKYEDFEMVMAGKEGPLSNAVKHTVALEGLSNKIKFPGYINMPQKHELAQQYDIYICTNKIDNAPVSLIEFMCFGLPIVSVNAGGIPYMITDEFNGLLVNSGDDEAMFQKICMLINDANLSQSVILNAHKYAQEYDEANVMLKWNNVFNELKSE